MPGSEEGTYSASTEVEIGDYAFDNCTSLVDVRLPRFMTYMSSYLFRNCTALQEITLPSTLGQAVGKDEIIKENGGIIGNGSFFNCVSLARIRVLFNYPTGTSLTVLGTSVFYLTGENVEGGVRIIVPSDYANNFRGWVSGTNEYYHIHADDMLYGDYLMAEGSGGYMLDQYGGDADIVVMDGDFAGRNIVALSESVFRTGITVSYGEFVVRASSAAGGWVLVSYSGSEDLDLTTLELVGRRVATIASDVEIAQPVTVKVSDQISYDHSLENSINIITITEE